MQKKIALFIVWLLVSHILLVLVGTSIGLRASSKAFIIKQGANWSQPFLKDVGEVRWLPYQSDNEKSKHNIQILFATNEMIAEMQQSGHTEYKIEGHSFNSWSEVVMPNLFLLALFIATPIALRRRALAYGLALLLLNGFLCLRLGLYTYKLSIMYSGNPSIFDTLLKHPITIIEGYPLLSIVVAFFLWLATAFRPSDFNRLFDLSSDLSLKQG